MIELLVESDIANTLIKKHITKNSKIG